MAMNLKTLKALRSLECALAGVEGPVFNLQFFLAFVNFALQVDLRNAYFVLRNLPPYWVADTYLPTCITYTCVLYVSLS
jgi:hypothetical protein